MQNIKVLSLFSGIGAFEKALYNLNIPFELVGYSEILKAPSLAYSKIHNVSEELNLGDVCKINTDKLPEFNLMTWGFPCTNFSIARRDKKEKRHGLLSDESGLYYEGLRILKECRPKISVIENTPDLLTARFRSQFDEILSDLSSCGYTSHYSVLNGAEHGIPQSRSRLFIVSIRNDIYKGFAFPDKKVLTTKVSDYLEDSNLVEDKFFKINPNIIEKIKERKVRDFDICPTITTAIGRGGSSSEYISNCSLVYHNTGVLRRMTPKETMLLNGFSPEDYDKAKAVTSDTQIYNFSGKTICVPVLEDIFKSLFFDYKYLSNNSSTTTLLVNYKEDVEVCEIAEQLCFNI